MSSMLSRERKWLFIHPPRTGGTSVSVALKALFKQKVGFKHWRLWEYDADPAEYFKFMTVRNPWARCASYAAWYESHGEYYGMDRAINSALPLEYYGLPVMDFVLRCEHLADDFATLCSRLGIPARRLPRASVVVHRPYRTYFDGPLRRLVASRFAHEIERFGYRF